jgi:guanylate kinase
MSDQAVKTARLQELLQEIAVSGSYRSAIISAEIKKVAEELRKITHPARKSEDQDELGQPIAR